MHIYIYILLFLCPLDVCLRVLSKYLSYDTLSTSTLLLFLTSQTADRREFIRESIQEGIYKGIHPLDHPCHLLPRGTSQFV